MNDKLYRIKPLFWVGIEGHENEYIACTAWNTYIVKPNVDDPTKFKSLVSYGYDEYEDIICINNGICLVGKLYNTVEEAKLVAEKDWLDTILSDLEEVK